MKVLKFRPKARSDLGDIWEYSVEKWGKSQAETYLRGIQKTGRSLCDGPNASQSAEHILAGCRKISIGSHVIYFREDLDEVVVIRILHQRMDVPKGL